MSSEGYREKMMINVSDSNDEYFEKSVSPLSISNNINYCSEDSTIHGLKYVGKKENLPYLHRYLWLFKITLAIALSIWMSTISYLSYDENQIVTRIDSSTTPVKDVFFPSITICNINKVSKDNFVKITNILKSHGISDKEINDFAVILNSFTTLNTYNYADKEMNINPKIFDILSGYNYSVETIMNEVRQKCDDLLYFCMFKGNPFDCTTNFVTIKCVEGFCCSFNYWGPEVSKKNKFDINPEVVSGNGILNGLTVVLNINSDDYITPSRPHIGAIVMLSQALDFPEISTKYMTLELNVSAEIKVEPYKIVSSPAVRSVSIQRRRCKFGNEIDSRIYSAYSFQTCLTDCKIKNIYMTCNCIPYYYPNPDNKPTCSFNDLNCLIQYKELFNSLTFPKEEKFNNSVSCDCMPECNDMFYKITIHQENINKSAIYNRMESLSFIDKSILSVYYSKTTCITYERDVFQYWNDLFATFGGLFSLCIGGSILSIIELIFKWIKAYTFKKDVKHNTETKFPFVN